MTPVHRLSLVVATLIAFAVFGTAPVAQAQEGSEQAPQEGSEQAPQEGSEQAPQEGSEQNSQAENEEKQKSEAKKAIGSEEELTDAERKKYEAHLKAGTAAYSAQDFEKAFQELRAAHEIYSKPSILFNLALISEKGGKLERAAEYYRKFLQAPGVTLENRKRASERLAAVREILETSESGEQARQAANTTDLLPALEAMEVESLSEAPTETAESPTPEGEAKSAETERSEEQTRSEARAERTPQGQSPTPDAEIGTTTRPEVEYGWPVYVSFATATGALVSGVVMVALMNDEIQQGQRADNEADLAAAEEQASMYATTAAGLFAGGALLAVVGSYFVIRDSISAQERARLSAAGAKAEPRASLSFSLHRNFFGPIFSLEF